MACCILTAVIMNQLIKICDAFDIRLIEIKYNDQEGDACAPSSRREETTLGICSISIGGMTCSACSSSLIHRLEELDGVHRATVSLTLARATVSFDASTTTPAELVRVVETAGYTATLKEEEVYEIIERLSETRKISELRQSISSSSICATMIVTLQYMPLTIWYLGPLHRLRHLLAVVSLFLAFKIQIFDAREIHMRAYSGGRRNHTMDTLLSLSLLLGLGLATWKTLLGHSQDSIAYASSSSFLTVIIFGGRYLETVLKKESHRNLAALYELQSDKETYRLANSGLDVPASLLKKGDDILIRPQATVPCDCFVLKGSSAINESSITGESLPVMKTVGDLLYAGTRNLSCPIRATVAQDSSESSLAKVIQGVSAATEHRLDGTEPLDVLMNYFVSGVVCLAAAAFFATMWNSRSNICTEAIMSACVKAAAVLAAACPCGLGLAIPSAAISGIDVAYSKGVLIGGGIKTMQAISATTHVVMDKTGTLTQGRLEVIDHHFSDGLRLNRQVCYRLLAAAEFEEARVHPVGKAIFSWALSYSQQNDSQNTVSDTRNIKRVLGMGVICEVRGHSDEWTPVAIGHASFLSSYGIHVPDCSSQEGLDPEASTIHFAFSNVYAGNIYVRDTIRAEAHAIVTSFLKAGLNVTMLTGDNAAEASRISSQLGISVLASRALPQDKVAHIKKLQRQGHRVAMVGDGINDAPAQATADVGISISLAQGFLSGAGSAVIISNDLHVLVDLFEISRKVVRQARFNIAWALIYNAAALSLTLGVWRAWGLEMRPNSAGIMMAGSSISVLGMSLWLKKRLEVIRKA